MGNNRYPDAERLLDLVEYLRIGEPVSRDIIVAYSGVSPSTAGDYLAFLRRMFSADLEPVKVNGKRAYRFRRVDQPTVEDITRAASVKFGEVVLDIFQDTKYHKEAQRASRSERGKLVRHAIEELDRLTRGLHRRTQGPSDYRKRARELEAWLDAVRTRRSIRMRYQKASGAYDTYVVQPLFLVLYQDRIHLLTRKQDSDDHRTFNLDGVQTVELLDSFAPPDPLAHDPRRVYEHSFGIFSDIPPERIVVTLRGSARVRAEQRVFHASQVDGPVLDDGWREFHWYMAICPEFRAYLLGLTPDVRVLAPESLRQTLEDRLREGLDAMKPAAARSEPE